MTRATKEPKPERIFVQEGDEFELNEFERTLKDKYGRDKKIIDWKELKGRTLEIQALAQKQVLFVRHPRTKAIIGLVVGQTYSDENERVVFGTHLLVDPEYLHWGVGKELVVTAQRKAQEQGYSIEMYAEPVPLLSPFASEEEREQARKVLIRYYQQLGFSIDEDPEGSEEFPTMIWRPKQDA